MNLPNTEPLKVVVADGGRVVAVPASTEAGVTASLSKWKLMRDKGLSADEAEAELARQAAERAR